MCFIGSRKNRRLFSGAFLLYSNLRELEYSSDFMVTPEYPVKKFKTPKAFESWLRKNHAKAVGVWLQFFKKASGIKGITYAEALDVALCYGWIDSLVNKYDENLTSKSLRREEGEACGRRLIASMSRAL
jgi:hypothetical protein